MLVFSRRIGERVMINENISFQILEIKGSQVRLGFDAPKDVSVHREEIYLKVKAERERLMGMDSDVNARLTNAFRTHSKSHRLTH